MFLQQKIHKCSCMILPERVAVLKLVIRCFTIFCVLVQTDSKKKRRRTRKTIREERRVCGLRGRDCGQTVSLQVMLTGAKHGSSSRQEVGSAGSVTATSAAAEEGDELRHRPTGPKSKTY